MTPTEELVYQVAPDGKAAQAGRELAQGDAFAEPRISPDGAWLFASCRGSERLPYQVLVHLPGPDRIVTACTCSSMKRPCKHALGLLLLAAQAPERFQQEEPSAALRKRIEKEGVTTPVKPAPERAKPIDVGEALFQAICAEPLDDAPRLIYADWLEENGDADRADFIRVQCRLAQLPADAAEGAQLRKREKKLWTAHRQKWLAHVPKHLRGGCGQFDRGFLGELALEVKALVQHGAGLFEHHPIHRVRVLGGRGQAPVAKLAVCPFLARLRSLSLAGGLLQGPGKWNAIVATPFLAGLTELDVSDNPLGSRGLAVLAGSPHLSRLERLDLGGTHLSDAALAAFLGATDLGQLRFLDLSNNSVGNGGAAALAGSPSLAGLRELGLGGNKVGPKGAKALAASSHLGELRSLDLVGSPIADAGARALAEPQALEKLEKLDVRGCGLEGPALALLERRFGAGLLAKLNPS